MELNRKPETVFAEVEQASFAWSSMVPGISFSPDRMLQARLFLHGDAARYRLGVNHNQIPVNATKCPHHSYHRDGAMRVDGNHGGIIASASDSRIEWVEQPDFAEPMLALEGSASHRDHRLEVDHFEQPGNLFRRMAARQKEALFGHTERAIYGVSRPILDRHVANCAPADAAHGAGVAHALGLTTALAAE